MYYNTVLNVGDRLGTHFDYSLDYMSTFPLFYNWFNFLVAIVLTVMASTLKVFPYHILANFAFILHIILFIVTPFALVYVEGNGFGFWLMIILSTLNGIPTPMNSSVFMGLSGMFSSIHSAIFFIGMAAGGLISSLLRILSKQFFSDSPDSDLFLTFYLNAVVVIISYGMYFYMYYCIPLTKECYTEKSEGSLLDEKLIDDKDENKLQGFIRVCKKMWLNLFSINFIFFVTLSIFPGFFMGTSYDESVMKQDNIVTVITFIFMCGDLLSRFAVYIPIPWNKWPLSALSLSRIIFYVPIFIYYYGVYTDPFVMFAIMLIFSFSNGYISAWAIQVAYKGIPTADMNIAGNLVMVSMNIGLSLGGTLLFLMNTLLPKP
ncbi:Nucleoside transporter [Entamoeba marina]